MVNPGRQVGRFSGGRERGGRDSYKRRNENRHDKPKTDGDAKQSKPDKESTEKMKQEPTAVAEVHQAASTPDHGGVEEKKFTGRCRLFVGNLPLDTEEAEFGEWFKPFGEFSEIFLNAQRGFGFIRMDLKDNAERAKKNIDGTVKRGRTLRVRFAAHTAAIRIKYLHPYVSNELLTDAFSMFGEVERAVVCIDEKGKANGEGIVYFSRKPGAMQALKRVNDGVFLMGSSPRPVVCEMLEHKDEDDGLPESLLSKNTGDIQKEREAPPRFAQQNSFEFNFSLKWKELYTQHEHRKKQLQEEFDDAVAKLELDEAGAQMEHQTAMMREDLLRRQEELRRMEEQHQMEMQKRMEMRRTQNNQSQDSMMQSGFFRRQQEEAKRHMVEEERRREEEARMFMQQELAMRQMQEEHHRGPPNNQGGQGNNAPPMQPPPAPPVSLAGPGGNRGRNHEMGMRNQGMPNQMHQGMQQMQGGPPQGNQNMRGGGGGGGGGGRKSDSDYRQSRFDQPPHQSRFDQPPQQFQGNNPQQQQMHMGGNNMMFGGQGGNLPNMGGHGSQGMGSPSGAQGNMGPTGQQGNMGPGGQGNMGGGPPGNMGPGGQGNMGGPPQGGQGGPQGGQGNMNNVTNMRGGGNQERPEAGGEFIEKKRSRRF